MIQGSGNKQNLMQAVLYFPCEPTDIIEWKIQIQGEKRSLDANNYAWALMDKIARAVKSSKEEVYLRMVERYGPFMYMPVMEKDILTMEKVFRVVRDRGVIEMTTKSGNKVFCHQLQCYKGSSLYDSKEMSDFIDGVISEAKNLGIETATPDELKRMKEQYEKHHAV